MRNAFRILLAASVGGWAACGGGQQAPAPRQATAEAPAKAAAVPAATKEIPPLFGPQKDVYSYNPVGKRDPFRKYEGEAIVGTDPTPRSPLEMYPLEQLKVTAIVSGISSPRALVTAPGNESFIVKKNMRIGKNRGRIARITGRAVYVEEEYRDPTGKLVVRESVMEIRPEKEKYQELEMQFSEE